MITTFIQNIKKAETPFYINLKRILQNIIKLNIPTIKPIHKVLYTLHISVYEFVKYIYLKLWVTPTFKAICESCGKNLNIHNGMPYVRGHLHIRLGDNVTLMTNTITSGHVYDNPTFTMGNNSTLGYESSVSCSKSVTIGNNVLIAERCFIADNSGHPINPEERLKHLPVSKSEIAPVIIGDNVWIGAGCTILKGVKIGDNSIIGSNSVITRSIPPNTLVATANNRIFKDYPRMFRGRK